MPTDVSLPEFLARARMAIGASECVVLRTCNRFEIYFVGPSRAIAPAAMRRLFGENGDSGEPLAVGSFYRRSGVDAAEHLFSVACGVDSMILGEHEILGQVKGAAREAVQTGHCGPILKRLFDHAMRAGKRARRETEISSGIFSVGQCAARTAQDVLGGIEGKRLLLFGAGQIAKVTAKHMAALGAFPVTVFSRTRAHAQELAALVGGRAITDVELPEALAESDILAGCTNAPHHVVTVHHIQSAMRDRSERPLVVVDLGVPRNVDPAVGQLPGVHLFNMDDLERVVAEHVGEREREIEQVRRIVQEEADWYQQWLDGTRVAALISELRAKAEQARGECLGLAKRQVPEEVWVPFDYLMDLLVRKLLHHPIAAIREASADSDAEVDLVAAARKLFGLGGTVEAEADAVAAGALLE